MKKLVFGKNPFFVHKLNSSTTVNINQNLRLNSIKPVMFKQVKVAIQFNLIHKIPFNNNTDGSLENKTI